MKCQLSELRTYSSDFNRSFVGPIWLPLRELATSVKCVCAEKYPLGQLCTLLKNRNVGLICLKMSVVAVWIPVWVSVKYLRIRININEMPAV